MLDPATDNRNPDPGIAMAQEDNPPEQNEWLKKATDAYNNSTDYCKTNVWRQWRKNLCHFRNQHDFASRYAQKGYVGRSKVFRPKTRASLRNAEAAFARAMFSNNDLVNITAGDTGSQEQRASAAVMKEILQYRLTKKLYWFLTAMGAYQDSYNYGVCISKQYWQYETDNTEIQPDAPVNIKKDDLQIDLLCPENFRFSPMADWRDPVATSPYLIELIPMYACDVLDRMKQDDNKTGQQPWHPYELQDLLAASTDEFNEVRRAREGYNRVDPADQDEGSEYSIVWIHQNIIKEDGQYFIYFTVGTRLLLTEPVPLKEVYPHGNPYVIGISIIEAHKNYPAGGTELGVPLQQEINDIANQRLDNVRLVLNKRYYIKRGEQVDIEALKRNIPGSGVLMNNPDSSVKTVDTNDVTSSSYQEQDRLNVEFDELIGNFSQASVQSNRNLNETVGGMNIMTDSANGVQEYTIRTFIESWVEPVLRQCIKLIQLYETDVNIVALCAKNAQLFQKFGVTAVTDQMLNQELTSTVNVGMGNTDPTKRVNKLMMGVNTALALPGAAERFNSEETVDEIFANLGFQDGNRFFKSEQQMQEEQQGQEPPPDPAMLELQLKQQVAEQEAQFNQQKLQQDMQIAQAKLQAEREIAMMRLALDKDIKLSELQSKLGLQQQQFEQRERQIQTTRDVAALREKNKMIDIDWKNKFAQMKYGNTQQPVNQESSIY